jgi:hypothetical protein
MIRILAALVILSALVCPSWAQTGVFQYAHITTDTTTTLKSTSGMLHRVCINTPAATGTVTIYDNTAGSGTVIGVITSFASSVVCTDYDVNFWTGLTIVTATAAPDITVSFR